MLVYVLPLTHSSTYGASFEVQPCVIKHVVAGSKTPIALVFEKLGTLESFYSPQLKLIAAKIHVIDYSHKHL